ncbi:glycosyltransferase family 2 protein [Micromonosporaceae bacterium Da 78-11]
MRFRGGHLVVLEDMRRLAAEYRFASDWLYDLGARQEIVDHTDTFFVEHILHPLAAELGQIAGALNTGADEQAVLPVARMNLFYKRLMAIFDAQITSFERKKYVSLSHEPNKAMNLNSYIGLMGGAYQEVGTPLGTALVTAGPNRADLVVPDPDYVLTLDADSVLLPEYALRLVHLLEQGAYAQHAVAQTPYSAYPGAATRVERISGATTDIQYIVHQGMTHYGATFRVGANAVLRKRALDEICEVSYEGDWEIKRYIQDRTVIEDTESTIDLGVRGWLLHNYPERLAYSATPPDFGSLCIQRQRWANGGLLILTRFADGSNPRDGLKAAAERGVHAALIQAAIASSASLPNGTWLSVNVSADLLRRPHDLLPLLAGSRRPLVLETGAADPTALAQLGSGIRLAVDDLGAGYETLSLLESRRPAFLKLGLDSLQGVENETAGRPRSAHWSSSPTSTAAP